jgi:RNA polymerase sigma-70 factor (ECF subfamily)
VEQERLVGQERMEALARAVLEPIRRELTSYLCRMVLRPHVAEEITQTTFVRALELSNTLPQETERVRAWIFRVATNLAIDELRRHSNWREHLVEDLRVAAEASTEFVAQSEAMIGTPETKAIARQHLVACFACTLKNLPEQRAASLLLKEVHGFALGEIAEILGATENQIKNWLQEARATMTAAYDSTCALIRKEGVCHQCVELDGYMRAGEGTPVLAWPDAIEARIAIVRQSAEHGWGPWHRKLFELLDEMR